MCGIAGILTPKVASLDLIEAMSHMLAHRGPDGQGSWRSTDGHCALGHRRLAIIDVSDCAAQPYIDSEVGLALTYNGEIYNYVELREQLLQLGHRFRSASDTEVLLRGYIEWGEGVLERLNGMFAFALWDARTQTLFCARDRFGEKPFYYTMVDDAFVFASEAKALSLVQGADMAIDDGVLAQYVAGGPTFVDGYQRTLLRGVQQLLPAEAMCVQLGSGGVHITRRRFYWSVGVDARHTYSADNATAAANRLRELITDSVRLRLRSDVRVGSCLSGGLDSSTVVATMRRLEPGLELRTFTGRFPGDPLDEGRYAELVAIANHTQSFEVSPTPERFRAEAERLYWHADFPIGGMSQFAQWCVFHLAAQHDVTVLLDGQGSDEQFGGYGGDISYAFIRQLIAQGLWSAALRERNAAALTQPWLLSWKSLGLRTLPLGPLRPALKRVTGRGELTLRDLVASNWYDAALAQAPEEVAPAADPRHALSDTLWRLSFRTMLSSLLRFGDRLSMAHSREVRLPFCDHRIAELAFQLSPELLVGSGEVKVVLRNAIRGLVPDAIVTRKKQGFVPPQDRWLSGPLSAWVDDLLHDGANPIASRLSGHAVRLFEDPDLRDRNAATLWTLVNLLAWGRFGIAGTHATRTATLPVARRASPSRVVTGHWNRSFDDGTW